MLIPNTLLAIVLVALSASTKPYVAPTPWCNPEALHPEPVTYDAAWAGTRMVRIVRFHELSEEALMSFAQSVSPKIGGIAYDAFYFDFACTKISRWSSMRALLTFVDVLAARGPAFSAGAPDVDAGRMVLQQYVVTDNDLWSERVPLVVRVGPGENVVVSTLLQWFKNAGRIAHMTGMHVTLGQANQGEVLLPDLIETDPDAAEQLALNYLERFAEDPATWSVISTK